MRRTITALLVAATACLAAAPIADAGKAKPANIASAGSCVEHTVAGFPAVACLNKTWHCSSAQNHTQVNVVIDSPDVKIDAIHLDSGCTGTIRIRVQTNSGDGVKVHDGAHDLTVYMGKPAPHGVQPSLFSKVGIVCTAKFGDVHQDGVQAMGGTDVTFDSPHVDCPTGNNGGLFVNGGRGGHGVPTRILFVGGFSYEGNASIHVGPNSSQSGARGVTMMTDRSKASPPACIRVDHAADAPVDSNNTCLTPK
jgi:hypothetical protein